jgi:hypothetical protein
MEDLQIQRAAREGKHRNRLAYPDAVVFQTLLEAADLCGVVLGRLNEIRLNPWNMLARLHQQGLDAFGGEAAVLIQLVATFFTDGLDTAFEGDAVSSAEKLETFFGPQVDPGLKAYGHGALPDLLQKSPDLPAHAEDFVDEVDIVDAPVDELVYFIENGLQWTLPKFVTEEGFVAEGAGIRAAASELHFRPEFQVIGTVTREDVM